MARHRVTQQPSSHATTLLMATVLLVPIAAILMSWRLAAASSIKSSDAPSVNEMRLFTAEELSSFTGRGGAPIYIAILGDVFDVSTGRKHYAAGHGYAHFAGRDGSRAFATGDSGGQGLTDSIEALQWEDLEAIAGWHKFYMEHDNYTHVGMVVGRHYDVNGVKITEGGFPWEALQLRNELAEERKRTLPDCNSRWSSDKGSEVWCTTMSGGIEREWVGVPRIYDPALDTVVLAADAATGQDGGASKLPTRCVCAPPEEVARAAPHLQVYEGCDPRAATCMVPQM